MFIMNSDTEEDVKPPRPQHICFVQDTQEAKVSTLPGYADLPMKTGEIFRNNAGQYSFMCFNCGLIFEDFSEIIGHCEIHYQEVKYNVSELVLLPETRSLSPILIQSMEPTVVPNESSLPTTSQVSVRRRKKKRKIQPRPSLPSNGTILDFPQNCPVCGVWCNNFREHMKNEHNFPGRIFQCFICGHFFKNAANLKSHMSTSFHNVNTCYHCAMEPPIKSSSEPRRHKCLFCKEWFQNHAEFKTHFRAAHDKDADSFFSKRSNCNVFTCYVCEREFPLRYYLAAHMKTHHDKFLRHICPTCGRRLRTFGQLTQHLKVHEGKTFQCEQCDKQFSYKAKLLIHLLCHKTELKFKCDFPNCPKAFKHQKYLKLHQGVHTQHKKYACKFCSASFNFTSGRRAHEKSQHNAL